MMCRKVRAPAAVLVAGLVVAQLLMAQLFMARASMAQTSMAQVGTLGAQEDIGIPECDRFITSYEVCVTTRVPATNRVTFTQQVAQLRTTWRSLAQDPQARRQLEAICRTQGEQMRRGLEPFGCAF